MRMVPRVVSAVALFVVPGAVAAAEPSAPAARTCPSSIVLVARAHYRAPSYELRPFSTDVPAACALPMFPSPFAPPDPGVPPPDIMLTAKAAAVVFTYHLKSNEPGVNDVRLDGLNLFRDDNLEISFVDKNRVATFVAIVNPSGNCTALATAAALTRAIILRIRRERAIG